MRKGFPGSVSGRVSLGMGVWMALAVSGAALAEPVFRSAPGAWGLDFMHRSAASGQYYMVETNGGGLAPFDYDGDGDVDLLIVDGGTLPGYEGPEPKTRLYRNDGGRFVDVTARSGIHVQGYGSGAAVGDIDGDGDQDVLVTAFGPNQLFRNRGDGTFEEVAAALGVADDGWGTSAAFADVDRDGDVDLYVTQYVDFRLDRNLACGDARRGLRGYCGPDVYSPQGDRFYRNQGDGRFVEATAEAGLEVEPGAGLALSFADLDGDGWVDLYVANDLTPNFLFRNLGDGTFEEMGLLTGTSHGPRGSPEAGMGVAVGDVDVNGRPDIVVTNYEGETQALYSQRGPLVFTDQRFVAGLGEPTLRSLAFGLAMADFDHDGDLDLAFANGHVRDNAAAFNPLSRYRQPNQLFENLTRGTEKTVRGRFREVTGVLDGVHASRSMATADLDGDGDLDLLIGNVDGPLEVYENLQGSPRDQALDLWFVNPGRQRSVVSTGETQQERQSWSFSSYLSQHGPTVHVGVGPETVDRLDIEVPGKETWSFVEPPRGRRLVIHR